MWGPNIQHLFIFHLSTGSRKMNSHFVKQFAIFQKHVTLNLCSHLYDLIYSNTPRFYYKQTGRVAQSVGHLTRKSGVLGSIPGLVTYFRFSFRFFKKGSCKLLAKVCARSTG